MFGDSMEENNKKEICESCESCNYDVESNMKLCKDREYIPIHIIIQDMTCPLEKW